MIQIDYSFLIRNSLRTISYRLLRQTANVALVSIMFFSAVSGSLAAVSTGDADGLPLGCCRFFEADAIPFVADASNLRSFTRTGSTSDSAWKTPAAIVTIVAQPSTFHWQFDYPAPESLPHRQAKASNFWSFSAQAFQFGSLCKMERSLFQLSPETQTKISLVSDAFVLEARAAISDCLFQQSPMPRRVVRLIKQVIPQSM